jgi:pimeloyl-ACP methyl ester carboxylesterase
LTEDIMESSQFEGGRVDFTFALPYDRPEDRTRLRKLQEVFHEHLGEFIYADDATTTLEDCVVGRLAESGQTLAIVEVGSGGSLAAALCHAQHADRVIAGVFVAPTEERLRVVLGVADTAWQQTPRTEQLTLLASTARTRTGASHVMVLGAVEQDPELDAPRVALVLQSATGGNVNKWQRWSGPTVSAQSGMIAELLDTLRRALKS